MYCIASLVLVGVNVDQCIVDSRTQNGVSVDQCIVDSRTQSGVGVDQGMAVSLTVVHRVESVLIRVWLYR